MLRPLVQALRQVGHPLQRELTGLWSARGGAYRIVYEVKEWSWSYVSTIAAMSTYPGEVTRRQRNAADARCDETLRAGKSQLLPPHSREDLQVDVERPVCLDRAAISGRQRASMFNGRRTHEGVVNRATSDAKRGQATVQTPRAVRAEKTSGGEVSRQQRRCRPRSTPKRARQASEHGVGLECCVASETDTAVAQGLDRRAVMLMILDDERNRRARVHEQLTPIISGRHLEDPRPSHHQALRQQRRSRADRLLRRGRPPPRVRHEDLPPRRRLQRRPDAGRHGHEAVLE